LWHKVKSMKPKRLAEKTELVGTTSSEDTKKIEEPVFKSQCALLGFRLDDHDIVGYLAFRSSKELALDRGTMLYKIVDDISEAKWFPCENYDNLSGFATPEKWLEFFNEEPSLKDWRFHLVKRDSRAGG